MENKPNETKAGRVFLIDFENVHEQGLVGIAKLGSEDTVHLFYTKNAAKISLDILSEVKAKLCFHKVNVGKQSLDMQLVSYLGYLIGTIGHDPEYIIVSNDLGFTNTLAFWGEKDARLSQMPSMVFEEAAGMPGTEEKEPAPAADVPAQEGQPKPAPVRGPTVKTQMNNKITIALRDKKVEGEKIGKVTATVMKLYGYRNFRQAAYRDIIKNFGQKEGLELYNIIKPFLTEKGDKA